ncbi:MAG: hypothetical protein F7C35_04405 [Desulfurococcales archaeon]|nr:hypothetical protein [Desulfurococcales archaeon]
MKGTIMPRVDRGSLALDIAYILSLGEEQWKDLLEDAESYRAIAVTKPSIVNAWVSGRPLRITLGVGSLVFPPKLGEERRWGRALLELSAPEWVDGCIVGAESGSEIQFIPGEGVVEGRIVPVGIDGPLQLALAGAYGRAVITSERPIAVVGYIDRDPVIWYKSHSQLVHTIVSGEALLRLKYYGLLARRCKW